MTNIINLEIKKEEEFTSPNHSFLSNIQIEKIEEETNKIEKIYKESHKNNEIVDNQKINAIQETVSFLETNTSNPKILNFLSSFGILSISTVMVISLLKLLKTYRLRKYKKLFQQITDSSQDQEQIIDTSTKEQIIDTLTKECYLKDMRFVNILIEYFETKIDKMNEHQAKLYNKFNSKLEYIPANDITFHYIKNLIDLFILNDIDQTDNFKTLITNLSKKEVFDKHPKILSYCIGLFSHKKNEIEEGSKLEYFLYIVNNNNSVILNINSPIVLIQFYNKFTDNNNNNNIPAEFYDSNQLAKESYFYAVLDCLMTSNKSNSSDLEKIIKFM